MNISLPQNRWWGGGRVNIDLPDDWKIHVATMAGDTLPVLDRRRMEEKIVHPIGSPPLHEIATGRKRAVILFDDMSRGTPAEIPAHLILEQLHRAGFRKEQIVFMCAIGTHGPLERDDFAKKLGESIVEEYAVYNHNPWDNLVDLGTTSRGHKVKVNAEVMQYDLKVGLGGLTPHPTAGFGGGSKIVLPGITGIDTVMENHKSPFGYMRGKLVTECIGDLRNKDLREDAEEVAQMVGLDFIVNLLLNTDCEPVELVAGHPLVAYYEGVNIAFKVYSTRHFDKVDVCVANANSKSNEAGIGVAVAADSLKEGGDIVLINHCLSGHVNHYLIGTWGNETSVRMSRKGNTLDPGIRKLVVYSPYKFHTDILMYGSPDRVRWCRTWKEVMAQLDGRGAGTTVAVFMDAILQYFADPEKMEYVPVNLNKYLEGRLQPEV